LCVGFGVCGRCVLVRLFGLFGFGVWIGVRLGGDVVVRFVGVVVRWVCFFGRGVVRELNHVLR